MKKIAKGDIYECLQEPFVEELFSHKGLHGGDILAEVQAKVVAVFGHPESDCYWCVVERGGEYWEIDLD